MRILYYGKDGGPESTCWGFWPIEIKSLFSVALLKFVGPSREVFHTHAFNSVSWLLKGQLHETPYGSDWADIHTPSWRPIVTKRNTAHKVDSVGTSWVLTFRGPWTGLWKEWHPRSESPITLTHGRKVV